MVQWQIDKVTWTHKAMPLVWISDICQQIGYNYLSKKFMMLTLIDDSIRDFDKSKKLDIQNGGVYFRLRYRFGMTHDDIILYSNESYQKYSAGNSILRFFPEYILGELDTTWISEYPTTSEQMYYIVNPRYMAYQLSCLGMGDGKALELLAAYVMAEMPGCFSKRRLRQFGGTTDYDVVCTVDGAISDYRSELGRYFICECKDWESPVDFTTISKFSRILISTKTKFGVLFSKNGITGEGTERYASRELKKLFQDSGIVIAVLDKTDLESIQKGKNLISLLRSKYEFVRLDLDK